MLDFILDLLYPESCVACHRQKTPLCEDCLYQIDEAPWGNEKIKARFSYADLRMRAAVRALKYRKAQRIAPILGRHLGEYILEDLSEMALFSAKEQTLIIPAPLSKERLSERGFNQAELLAREVAKIINLEVVINNLTKTRHTPTQVSLKDKELRLTNLSGAFSIIHPEQIKGKTVILIDDVYTTGATIREITRTLRTAGARKTLAYTVAH